MNSEITEIGIEATIYGTPPSVGAIRVRPLGTSERIWNGLAKFGTFLGIALVCVFFPIVHLVLVPLSLMMGLHFASKTIRVRDLIVSGSISCPKCGEPCILNAKLAQWPMTVDCSRCRRHIGIRLVEPVGPEDPAATSPRAIG